jgi:hypothetical protein
MSTTGRLASGSMTMVITCMVCGISSSIMALPDRYCFNRHSFGWNVFDEPHRKEPSEVGKFQNFVGIEVNVL